MAEKKDYREVLGVSDDATVEQIQRAYRKLAMKFHPDMNNSPEAAAKFKEIREAYAVLTGKEKPPKTIEPMREPEIIFRHAKEPALYEFAEFSLKAQRVWDELANEKYSNTYR